MPFPQGSTIAACLTAVAVAAGACLAQTRPGEAQATPPTSQPATPPQQPAPPPASEPPAEVDVNPAAPGFDHAGSDLKAMRMADMVMEKMGGRAAWDATRHLTWDFFGRRRHWWDRVSGDIRIEGKRPPDDSPYVILMNVNSRQGRAWVGGNEIAGDELAKMLERGYEAWINDSYWLLMPYKLKDSGVTLSYLGDETRMDDGRAAWVLRLRFKDVGVTPENEYHVYVAMDTKLVEQWDFYRNAGDEQPMLRTPWRNWQRYGAILLSDDRGIMNERPAILGGIAVHDELPRSVYESPEPVAPPAAGSPRGAP